MVQRRVLQYTQTQLSTLHSKRPTTLVHFNLTAMLLATLLRTRINSSYSIQAVEICFAVCMCVNQAGTSRNRSTWRLVILHGYADIHKQLYPDISCTFP